MIKKEFELIDLISSIDVVNLKNNLRRIGITDLMILENIIDNDLEFYSLDKHFNQMEKILKIKMYNDK